MEVVLMVHPAARHFRGGGGEFVVHLSWVTTGGSNEPRGTTAGRLRENWIWERNEAGMPTNWHCFSVVHGGPPDWKSIFKEL